MDQSVPDDLKLGIVTPVHKKQKKTDPNSYRRITVNSMIWKIIDMEITTRMEADKNNNGSIHQFGFKRGLSCINAGLVLSGVLMEAKDTKKHIYTCSCDLQHGHQ